MADTFNTPSNSIENEARILEQQKAVRSIMEKLDRINGVFRDEQGGLWFASKAQKYSTGNHLNFVSEDIKKLEQEALTTHTTIKGLDAVQKKYFEMRTGIGDLYENISTDLDIEVLYKILAPMNAHEALGYLTEIHGKINSNTYQSDALKRRYKEVIGTLHKQVLGKLETMEDKKTFFRIITGRNAGVSDDFKDTVLASQVLLEIENADQSTKEMAANFRGEGWELSDENMITSKNVAKWVGVAAAAVWGTVLAAPLAGATGLGAVAAWGVAGAVGWASAATANNVAFGKWYESIEEAGWDIGSQVALGAVLGAWGSRIQTIKGGAFVGATGGVTETLRSATVGWQGLQDWKALAKGGGLGLGIALVLAVVTRGKWAMRIKWDQVVVEDVPVGTVAEVKDAIKQAGAAATNPEGKKAAEEALKRADEATIPQSSDDLPAIKGELLSKEWPVNNKPLQNQGEIAEGEFKDIFEYTHPADKASALQNARPGDVVRLKNAPWLMYQKQADGTWAQIGGNNRKVQRHNVSEQEVVGKMVKVADNRVLVLEREGEIVPQAEQRQETWHDKREEGVVSRAEPEASVHAPQSSEFTQAFSNGAPLRYKVELAPDGTHKVFVQTADKQWVEATESFGIPQWKVLRDHYDDRIQRELNVLEKKARTEAASAMWAVEQVTPQSSEFTQAFSNGTPLRYKVELAPDGTHKVFVQTADKQWTKATESFGIPKWKILRDHYDDRIRRELSGLEKKGGAEVTPAMWAVEQVAPPMSEFTQAFSNGTPLKYRVELGPDGSHKVFVQTADKQWIEATESFGIPKWKILRDHYDDRIRREVGALGEKWGMKWGLVPMTEGRSLATITPETSTTQWPQSMVDALGLKTGEYPWLKGSPNKGKIKTVETEKGLVPVSDAIEVPADVAKDPSKFRQFIKEQKEKAEKDGKKWWPLLLFLLPLVGLTLCSGPEENPVLTPVKPDGGKPDGGGNGGIGSSGSKNAPSPASQQPRTVEEICQECDPNNPLSKLTLGRTNRLKQKIKLDESTRERITSDYMKTKKYQAFKHAWIDTPPKNQTPLYKEVVQHLQKPTMENIQAMQRCISMKAVDTEEGQDGILGRRTLAAMITALSKECYPDKEKMDGAKSIMLQKTQQEFSEDDLLEPNLNSVPQSSPLYDKLWGVIPGQDTW